MTPLVSGYQVGIPISDSDILVKDDFAWEVDRWYPLYCQTIKETRNYDTIISGNVLFFENDQIYKSSLHIIYASRSPSGIENHPLFIKKHSNLENSYEIASIEVNSELDIQPFFMNAIVIKLNLKRFMSEKKRSKARLIKKNDVQLSNKNRAVSEISRNQWKKKKSASGKQNEPKNNIKDISIEDFASELSKKWGG